MRHPCHTFRLVLSLLLLVSLGGCWFDSSETTLGKIQQQLLEGNYRSAEITAKSLLTEAQSQSDKELERATRLLLARIYFRAGDNANSARFYAALPLPVDAEAEPVSASISATAGDWHQWLLAAWDSSDQQLAAGILKQAGPHFDAATMAIYRVRQLVAAGNSRDAMSAFELTQPSSADSSPLVRYQYALLRSASDTDGALAAVTELTDKYPDFAQAVLLQARLLQARADHSAALSEFNRYTSLRPADAQARILATLSAFQVGEYDAAREQLKTLGKQIGKHPMVLQLKGMLALHDQQFDDAKAFAEESLSHGLESPMNHLLIGIGAYQQQAWEQANRYLAMVNDQLPKDHFAKKMLVETKLQLNEPRHAAAIFKDLDTRSAIDVALANRVSAKLLDEGSFGDASAVQQQVAAIEVEQEELVLQRQVLNQALQRNQFKQALIESVKTEDAAAKDKLRLILLYLADNEMASANNLVREWLQATPKDVNALNAAALVEQRGGHPARVKKYLAEALAIDPQNIPSLVMQLNLARIDKDLPAVIKHSETLMEDVGFVNPLIFNYWLEANLLLEKLYWEKALRLVQADQQQQLEGALLRFLLKSRQYDQLEQYLASQVPPRDWLVRHWAAAILAAVETGNRELASSRIREFITTAEFNQAEVAQFTLASAARAGLYELMLSTLKTAEERDIAIENGDLIASSAYLKLGQLDKARQLLAQHPIADTAFFEVTADLAMAEKKYRDAWQALEQAIKPTLKFNHLAQLHEVGNHTNQRSKVKEYVRAYFKTNPADNTARRRVSQWYLTDSPRFAIELLDSGSMQAELKSDWVTTNNLAWLYHQVGDSEKARRFAEHAISRAPQRPEVIDTYETVFGHKPKS